MSEPAKKTAPNRIRVLPEVVINQIAAGEVVDRPASVVRELLDNAIDAGATDIAVFLEEGGHSLIRVVDNGVGMSRDDAILAFERHATSKISNSEELHSLSTLGFRGEALPSIASVSQLRVKTKTVDDEIGTEVLIWGGKLKDVKPVVTLKGTDIEVGKLFFNTPARRKFLRQASTEEQRVKLWMQHAALPFPQIRYRLFSSGREILNLAPTNFIDRAREIVRGSSLEFSYEVRGMEISGLIGHPALASSGAEAQVIIINGRIVKDRILAKAIREGFDSTLKAFEIPAAVVQIEIEPGEVDVNVHPQKSEVRFRSPQNVFQAVREAIQSAVRRFGSPFEKVEPVFTKREFERTSEGWGNSIVAESPVTLFNSANAEPQQHLLVQPKIEGLQDEVSAPSESAQNIQSATFRFSDLNYIGQALACYLICELGESLYVVDMHAAHERYNFNLIRNKFREKGVPSQQLLLPLTLELSPEAFVNCANHIDAFARFGFEVELFGTHSIVVRSAPTIFKDGDLKTVIKEVSAVPLEGLADGRILEKVDHISARIACHASIRSGRSMAREEVYALFAALDSTEFAAACPHGRPVIVPFSRAAVERWFGRDR